MKIDEKVDMKVGNGLGGTNENALNVREGNKELLHVWLIKDSC